ncbi:class I SAM-dependent methyltransferase [Psychrobacter sp. I-STPA10]|uniref:class I SAM-dependent methyltransferase n=1 Tax=Psychrobacter sp. I-STPA10 TaxID=2585769 RepID=UPI001E3C6C10|nr:class I SAM-dependent methyltransferase [Psychrobacter sp. I-STPA10]
MTSVQSDSDNHHLLLYPRGGEELSAVVKAQLTRVSELITTHHLPIALDYQSTDSKLSQKNRQKISAQLQKPVLIIDEKGQLSLLIDGISVSPNWVSLQRRIVSAGRKSELLLQAAKLTADSQVIDATAGFGHDSLILASSGSKVTMLEQQPILALLLLAEQQKMVQQKNWQKLMARLSIVCIDAKEYLTTNFEKIEHIEYIEQKVDVVYLDPMFPDDSYENSQTGKGAKVGKHMQALHGLVAPPDLQAQQQLLDNALARVKDGGRVVVKRPVNAPNFAERTPDEIWQNNVIRFDGYFV